MADDCIVSVTVSPEEHPVTVETETSPVTVTTETSPVTVETETHANTVVPEVFKVIIDKATTEASPGTRTFYQGFTFADSGVIALGVLPAGWVVSHVVVCMSESFDDASATIVVGTSVDDDHYFVSGDVKLAQPHCYEYDPFDILTPPTTNFQFTLDPAASTAGIGFVLVQAQEL